MKTKKAIKDLTLSEIIKICDNNILDGCMDCPLPSCPMKTEGLLIKRRILNKEIEIDE